MQCASCGHPFEAPDPRFCPACGAPVSPTPSTGPTPSAGPAPGAESSLAQVARSAQGVADAVAAGVHQTLEDPRLLERIPGRSVSIAGLAVMALAILLTWLPSFGGIGFWWSLIMLVGGALVAIQELRLAGMAVPGTESLPAALTHPLIPPVFAALTAVHAFGLLRLGIVPLLWLLAAVLLCYDQYKKAILAPNSFGQYFDLRLAWFGYRRYILMGTALCLISLFFTWGKTGGFFSGGYTYQYLGGGESGLAWNFLANYNPLLQWSGRNQPLSTIIEIALLTLVVWSAYRGDGTVPKGFNVLAAILAGLTSLWWLGHIGRFFGIWLFFVGVVLVDFAVVMIIRGQHEGAYDMAHLIRRSGRP